MKSVESASGQDLGLPSGCETDRTSATSGDLGQPSAEGVDRVAALVGAKVEPRVLDQDGRRAQFADREVTLSPSATPRRWAGRERGRQAGCNSAVVRAPTTSQGQQASTQRIRIASGKRTTRSATLIQKPASGICSRLSRSRSCPATCWGCAERPEDRPAKPVQEHRRQRQGGDQGDRQAQGDRRAGVLDLGERREPEHPQADDHRPRAGHQRPADLRDRLAKRVGRARPRISSSRYRAIRNRQ